MSRVVRSGRTLGRSRPAGLIAGILPLLATMLLPSPASGASAPWETRAILAPRLKAPVFAPGQLLVKFPESISRAEIERVAREEGGTLVEMVTPDGLAKLRFDASADVVDAMRRWNRRTDIEYAAPNLVAHAFFVPNDTTIAEFDLGWSLRQVRVFDAWDIVTGSPKILLAIIDSGVAFEDHPVPDYERPFLWPGTTMYRRSPELPGRFRPGWDFVNNDAHPDDDNGHGTFVATIAAGQANNVAGSAGIAFGVTLLPIKVIDYRGDAFNDNLVKGIRFAADQRADVINLSLGYPPISFLRASGFTDSMLVAIFKPLRDAVRYAQRRGATIVAASGNFDAGEVSLPAGFPGVIAVGGTNVDMSRASYSSYGRGLDFMAPGGDFTELNGDGIQDFVAMMSIKPHRSEGSLAKPDSFGVFFQLGTSNSSAHVSGAVSLLMSLGVKDEDKIVRALRDTAINPFSDSPCFDSTYGYGLIQIDKAVRKLARHKKPRHWRHFAQGEFEVDMISPNPVRGAAELELRAARAGTVTARVFDVRGALVRTLAAGPVPTGTSMLRWDGRNDRGDAVPTGIYFFRIETPEGSSSHKVAFLR